MILPASLLLLPFVLADLSLWDRLSITLGYKKLSEWADDYDAEPETVFEPLPDYRLFSGSGPGSFITCWPSKGGIYALPNIHNAQREFLGIDRYVSSILRPEVSTEAEDAFCNQICKLGARWWERENDYEDDCHKAQSNGYTCRDVSVLYVGWPASGGVWALNAGLWNASDNGYGVIYNSINMEEQCKIIEKFGGTFYQDPKDCPYLDLSDN